MKRFLKNGITETEEVEHFFSKGELPESLVYNRPKDLKGNEIVFYASNQVYDGRFANNAWLQETPDSISKVTWDNVAIMSSATAKKIGVKN